MLARLGGSRPERIEVIAKARGLDLKRILENKLEMVCPAVIVTNEGADIEFCLSMLNDDYEGPYLKDLMSNK